MSGQSTTLATTTRSIQMLRLTTTKLIPPFDPIFKSDDARTTIPARHRSHHRSCCCRTACCMVSWSEEGLDMVAIFYSMVIVFHDMVVIYRIARVGSTFFFCPRISFTGNSDAFVSDGRCKQYTAPRTCHTRKHFSSVAQGSSSHCSCVISQNSHLHRLGSCLTRNVQGVTAFLFHLRTAIHPCFLL